MFSGQSPSDGGHIPEALGQSDAFLLFQEQVSGVAPVDRPVLIIGERGTGKELAASRIHFLSKRWQKPFVTLNCAALTQSLIASELFGYEKGAFTGAAARQEGRFEKASGGTFFLDEIGTIPMEVQEKILRVVEYGSFERVGSSSSIEVDVRMVAATNADLKSMAHAGTFKQDLLDRLSFEVLWVPPLRERKGDILFLANHFAARMAFELGQEDAPVISPSAVRRLEAYPWPGNVRELKNVVERAVYKSGSGRIEEVLFDLFDHPYGRYLERKIKADKPIDTVEKVPGGRSAGDVDASGFDFESLVLGKPLKKTVLDVEFYLLTRALTLSRYNQKKAARMLGLTYDQFRGLKKKHDAQMNNKIE